MVKVKEREQMSNCGTSETVAGVAHPLNT